MPDPDVDTGVPDDLIEPPQLGGRCLNDPGFIAKACSEDSIDKLVCLNGAWSFNGTCDGDARCSLASGSMQGTCRPIAPRCLGKQPGQTLCDGRTIVHCSKDLISTSEQACGANLHCLAESGTVSCACNSGYRPAADGCADIDECAANNGGCDPRRACHNTEGASYCGDCPTGYAASGSNGYQADGPTGCVDIDECALAPSPCDGVACFNYDGYYLCELPRCFEIENQRVCTADLRSHT